MPSGRDGDPDADSPPPECPRCGTPIGFLTVSGPMTALASPCGCTVPPNLVHTD